MTKKINCKYFDAAECCNHPERKKRKLPKYCSLIGPNDNSCDLQISTPKPDVVPVGQGLPNCPDSPPMPPVKPARADEEVASYYQRCPACEGTGLVIVCPDTRCGLLRHGRKCQDCVDFCKMTCPGCDGKGVLPVKGQPVPDKFFDALQDLITGKKRLQVDMHGPYRGKGFGPL